MLVTPFGQIKVLVDGESVEFEAKAFEYPRPPVKDDPIEGCYRIHVPIKNNNSVKCVLELKNKKCDAYSDYGENYLCKVFEYATSMIAIGVEDVWEEENPFYYSVGIYDGVKCIIESKTKEITFGVAWTTNYKGTDDVRVWYAADPTLDRLG